MLGNIDNVKNLIKEGCNYRLVNTWNAMPIEVVRAVCNHIQQRLRAIFKYNEELFKLN